MRNYITSTSSDPGSLTANEPHHAGCDGKATGLRRGKIYFFGSAKHISRQTIRPYDTYIIVPPLPASRITGPYDPSSPPSPSPSPYSPIFSGIILFNPPQSLPRTGLDGLLGTLPPFSHHLHGSSQSGTLHRRPPDYAMWDLMPTHCCRLFQTTA
jgi:hypothetical protein